MFWVDDSVTCYVCGEVSEHTSSLSVSASGHSDLDTRPPEMLRSFLYYQIQRCPSCGYCSNDISKGHNRTVELVTSEDYQKRIESKETAEETASFYNLAEDKALQGDYADAARNAIYAAWTCDDMNTSKNKSDAGRFAPWFRGKALIFASKGAKKSQYLSKSFFIHYAILIDLMRRGGLMEREGDFELALECAKFAKERFTKKAYIQLIDFQISLILNKDSGCHNLSEIPNWEGTYSIPTGSHLSEDIL